MSRGGPSDLMAVMDRRGPLVRALGDGPLEKHELEDRLDVSRSTIDRGVRELEERGLVTRTDGRFERTLAGRIALGEYDRFAERFDGLCDASDVLSGLDPDVSIDAALIAGARVEETTRTAPHRPLEALYEVVEPASRVRGFAPVVRPRQVEVYSRRVFEEGMRAELVLSEDAVERMLAAHGDSFGTALDSDRVTIWRTDATMPYSLTLAETGDGIRVAVVVYDEQGVRGCILNDTEAAVEWAERQYDAMLDSAETFD